jgi:hypothetical protein
MWRRVALVGLVAGCGAAADDTFVEPTDPGACGEVTTHDVSVLGAVTSGGAPAVGAAVRLEDRGWNVGDVLGEATTGADGTFTLAAASVTSVEDCWGTILDYALVGELGGEAGEMNVNTALFNAIEDGSLEADTRSFPVALE